MFCDTPENNGHFACLSCDENMRNCDDCEDCPDTFYKDLIQVEESYYCKKCWTKKKRFVSKPMFSVLEAVYYSNYPDRAERIDFYLIRGHWKREDLKVVNECLTYKGKRVDCPYSEDCMDWEGAFEDDPDDYDKLVFNEEVDELRFADDDWEDLFEGHTLEDIVVYE